MTCTDWNSLRGNCSLTCVPFVLLDKIALSALILGIKDLAIYQTDLGVYRMINANRKHWILSHSDSDVK